MKTLGINIIAVFFLFGLALQAAAAPLLMLGSATVRQGETGSIEIMLVNGEQPYAGMNASVVFPDGIRVIGYSEGALLNSGNFTIRYQMISDGGRNDLAIIAYSGSQIFNGDSGVLLSVSIKADLDAPTGTYLLNFADNNPNPFVNSKYALSNSDGTLSITPAIASGSITILELIDTDDDGLPDSWEQLIVNANPDDEIKDIGDVSPFVDFEGDGYSNLREYLSNSDPVELSDIPNCWADVREDTDVDGDDIYTFVEEYGRDDCSIANTCDLDMDGDGYVNELDLLFFTEDYGRTDCEF